SWCRARPVCSSGKATPPGPTAPSAGRSARPRRPRLRPPPAIGGRGVTPRPPARPTPGRNPPGSPRPCWARSHPRTPTKSQQPPDEVWWATDAESHAPRTRRHANNTSCNADAATASTYTPSPLHHNTNRPADVRGPGRTARSTDNPGLLVGPEIEVLLGE